MLFKFYTIPRLEACKYDRIGILGGSTLLKLPQIVAILFSGDVAGISPISFYCEVDRQLTIFGILMSFVCSYQW